MKVYVYSLHAAFTVSTVALSSFEKASNERERERESLPYNINLKERHPSGAAAHRRHRSLRSPPAIPRSVAGPCRPARPTVSKATGERPPRPSSAAPAARRESKQQMRRATEESGRIVREQAADEGAPRRVADEGEAAALRAPAALVLLRNEKSRPAHLPFPCHRGPPTLCRGPRRRLIFIIQNCRGPDRK